MDKQLTLLLSIVLLIWGGNVVAQDSEDPFFVAIDAYQCNFKEGKGRGDLDAVVVKWNKWMDDAKTAPYTAWVMIPVLKSINMPIDVVWLGAWQNGNFMGKGMQAWATDNGGLQEEFDKVMSCGEHSQAASLNIRQPGDKWPAESGVAAFANCTVAEGKTIQDAMDAHRAWAAHLDSIGSKTGIWAFFPGFGNNNPEWDYKIVTSYPDYLSYGADWEAYTNGQGWQQAQKIMAGIVSCDSARLYQSTTVRNGGVNPAPGG